MMNSYKGKILISTPDVSGDIFSRSVVLMVDHSENGAFGLILNKKNEDVSRGVAQLLGFDVEVYEGGPVENDKTFFIVKGQAVNDYHLKINENYYLTEDTETIIEQLLSNRLDVNDVKVFSGYSGWAAMQLEGEVQRKYWTVVDIYDLDYTLSNDHNLWKKIMQNLGGEFLIWANAPQNISLN
ncbi:YqgE/AlgH family protein [Marnyiella aurantia]